MWIHIVIFGMLLGVFAGLRLKIFPEDFMKNRNGRKVFFIVAILGNILGMAMSVAEGGSITYNKGHQLKKTDHSYVQEFQVEQEGRDVFSLEVKIPGKETEEASEILPERELSEREKYQKELQELLKEYNEERADPDYYYLPEELNGENIRWKTIRDTSGALISALCLIAAGTLMIQKEREELMQQLKRNEELLLEYPGMIMKFTLLIQAGMTARKAFQKMSDDYKRRKERKIIAYEEISKICYELDTGVSEIEAYRRFGERCGQVKYKTFSTLLIQNLQKGSRHMGEMLEKESTEAWEERKRKARVLGEAAATKLIIPMGLMLVVVMAIIMIPACLSFYGGM